ncbi:TPA: hypothetical protein ACH3X3_001406 [Trebouxia sp. C0006]
MAESSPTPGRQSLLDVVQQKQSDEMYKTPTVSRCMYVARRAGETTALSEIAAIHKEPLEPCCEDGGYAGLLILFPKCLLHIVEVDSNKMVPVLHALHLAGGTAQLQDIKVISSTDNVPVQLFSQWQVTSISCDCKDQHEGLCNQRQP